MPIMWWQAFTATKNPSATLLWVHSSCLGCASNYPTMSLSKCWIYFELHLRWVGGYFQVVFWVSSFWFASLPAWFFGLVKVITAFLSWMNSGDFISKAFVPVRSQQTAIENCYYMIYDHARCSQRCLIAFGCFELFDRGCYICLQLFRSWGHSHDAGSWGRRTRWKRGVIRCYLSFR
jgi:hypothetical protein